MDKTFIQQNILQELGLQDLPTENQAKLLTEMTESILKRITIRVLEQLSEQDKEEFDKVRETSNPDKITAFLKSKIENYDQMTEKVVREFKEEMKDKIALLQQA